MNPFTTTLSPSSLLEKTLSHSRNHATDLYMTTKKKSGKIWVWDIETGEKKNGGKGKLEWLLCLEKDAKNDYESTYKPQKYGGMITDLFTLFNDFLF